MCYFVCTLAIAGASIPYANDLWGMDIGISGFYSKDGIIAGTVNYGHAMAGLGWAAPLFYWGPLCVAYLTVFYMARSFALTFLGKPRDVHLYDHAHEVPWTMYLPQVCLAAMAILAAPFIMPFWFDLIVSSEPGSAVSWVQRATDLGHGHAMHTVHAALLHGWGWIIALVAGILLYLPGMKYSSKIAALPGVNILYTWAHNKFYFDALYDVFLVGLGKTIAAVAAAIDKYLVDGVVNLAGWITRVFSFFVGAFDNSVVDGAVNGAASVATAGGQVLRTAHGRQGTRVCIMPIRFGDNSSVGGDHGGDCERITLQWPPVTRHGKQR